MNVFVRAVITGFGFSLGKMIFEKAMKRYSKEDDSPPIEVVDANLQDDGQDD